MIYLFLKLKDFLLLFYFITFYGLRFLIFHYMDTYHTILTLFCTSTTTRHKFKEHIFEQVHIVNKTKE
jgi:hypothetical protein